MKRTEKTSHRGSRGFGSLRKRAMKKAKTPTQTRIAYRGSIYHFFDAFSTVLGADAKGQRLRTFEGRTHANNYTKAITVDLGGDAGRLRYAVFVAKGRKI